MSTATDQQMHTAELVYLRRVIKKLPVSKMAEVIGVTTEDYLQAERGEREFTLDEAIKIANHMKMPITYVFPKIFGNH